MSENDEDHSSTPRVSADVEVGTIIEGLFKYQQARGVVHYEVHDMGVHQRPDASL